MSARAFSFDLLASEPPAVAAGSGAGPDLEALRAAARAEGFAAGREEALQAVAPALAALATAADEVRGSAGLVADRLEGEAVDLAVAVAERILAGTLAVEPERVVEAVRGALRGITDRSRVTVFVNPDDLELVRDAMGELATTLGGIEAFEVQAERRVGRGGAVVRHPEGDVDAQLATKLERVRELVEGLE